MNLNVLFMLLLVGCAPKTEIRESPASEMVKFRSLPTPPSEAAEWLLAGASNATWDSGLEEAARLLVQASPDRLARLSLVAPPLAFEGS